jgi:hypothetical protein
MNFCVFSLLFNEITLGISSPVCMLVMHNHNHHFDDQHHQFRDWIKLLIQLNLETYDQLDECFAFDCGFNLNERIMSTVLSTTNSEICFIVYCQGITKHSFISGYHDRIAFQAGASAFQGGQRQGTHNRHFFELALANAKPVRTWPSVGAGAGHHEFHQPPSRNDGLADCTILGSLSHSRKLSYCKLPSPHFGELLPRKSVFPL